MTMFVWSEWKWSRLAETCVLPVAVAGAIVACADNTEQLPSSDPIPPLVSTGDLVRTSDRVMLPGLVIRAGKEPRIEAKGKIAITEGILEFLACEPGTRDYESLLVLDCKPSALQFALLLIGCETGAVPAKAEAPGKVGSSLKMEVSWQAADKEHRVPVETLLMDRKTKKPPVDLNWIFTGSPFVRDVTDHRWVFLGDQEQAHIAVWYQPGIPVNLGSNHGNPYQDEEAGFDVNTKAVPPEGTPITLIIHKVKN